MNYYPPNLRNPQHDIREYWPGSRNTVAAIQDDFDAMATEHRHATHALLHMQKAMGHIAGLLAACDHQLMPSEYPNGDPTISNRRSSLAQSLADIVICAAKIASEMGVDLAIAVPSRINHIASTFPLKS